jgi:hypothetical protein
MHAHANNRLAARPACAATVAARATERKQEAAKA